MRTSCARLASAIWPLVVRNYGQLVPPHQTPIAGVFITTMAQVYPEDRGTNYAIRDGRAVALLAARSASLASL